MINARFFIPLFFLFAVLFHAKSFAFAPASVSAYGLPTSTYTGMQAGAGGAGSVAGGAALATGAAAFSIGMALGYFGLDYILGDGEEGSVRIPLTNDPAKQIPAPYADPSTPVIAGALTYTVGGTAYSSIPISDSSASAACTARFASDQAGRAAIGITWWWVFDEAVAPYCRGHSSAGGGIANVVGFTSQTSPSTCPSGYTSSGGVCVLTDARVAAPDHACDMSRTGSALAVLSDPDCSPATLQAAICAESGTTCLGGGATLNGYDSWKIVTRPDGGTDITYYKQLSPAGYTPIVEEVKVGVGSDGTVDTVTSVTTPGTVSPPASDPVTGEPVQPVLDPVTGNPPAPVTAPAPVGSVTPEPAPNTTSISFPNDYARIGEASGAADKIVNKLDTALKPLIDTVAIVDPVAPVAADMPTWGETFTNLASWQLPAHSSVCPQPSMDLSNVLGAGNTFVLDSHCALFDANKNSIQAAMMVVFSVMALFIVLRA